MNKQEWREWAATLPPIEPHVADEVASHLLEFVEQVDGLVLTFAALPDEVPAGPLTGDLALPRLGEDGSLTLHLDDGIHETHRYGISQPLFGAPTVDPHELDAVLVPARVFDRAGYRLGRGGGHYDRLLPHLRPDVPIVGVTAEERLVDVLPREPHDVPMTHLVTELGVNSTK